MTNNSAIVAPSSTPAPAHKSSTKRGFHPLRYLRKVGEGISALLPNVKQKATSNTQQAAASASAVGSRKATEVIRPSALVVTAATSQTYASIAPATKDAPLVGPENKWLLEAARFPTKEIRKAWIEGEQDVDDSKATARRIESRGGYGVPDSHQPASKRTSEVSVASAGGNSEVSQRPSLASISTASTTSFEAAQATVSSDDPYAIYDNLFLGSQFLAADEPPEFDMVTTPIPVPVGLTPYSSMKNMVSRGILESRSKEQLRVAKDSTHSDAERIAAFDKAIASAEHGAALGSVSAANDLLVMHREGVLQKEGEPGKYLVNVNRAKSMFWLNVTGKLGKQVDKSNVLQNIEYNPVATNKLTDPVTKMVRFIEISRAIHDPGAAYYKEKYVGEWFEGFSTLQRSTQGLHLTERPDMPSFVWGALNNYKVLQDNRYA